MSTDTDTSSTVLIAVPDAGEWRFEDEETPGAITASAIPVKPPKSWFEKPDLSGPTALTVTPEGRVFGHAAAWGVRHIGLPGHRTAPRSSSGYRYYRTGQVECDDGTMVDTGRLSLGGGHADIGGNITAATEHYDATSAAVSDLACGEDSHGIWFAGALRPETTPEQIRALRASSVSGDWRPIGHALELCGLLAVNVGGFPTPRAALAASGETTALIAAGAIPRPSTITITTTPRPDDGEDIAHEEDAAMAKTDEKTDTPAEEPVTAAAPPTFSKDQVISVLAERPIGMVASVDGGVATVTLEVPVEQIADAGAEGRMALSASAQQRLLDNRAAAFDEKMQAAMDRMEGIVASAEAKQRGADALGDLTAIPDAEGNG